MMERLRRSRDFVLSSLWFIPALMGAAAAALAFGLLTVGADVPDDADEYWLLYAGDIENARELLSSLLSGMINMTALVVSITMVVLTLAAGQIGPRLIRNFIQDRTTQLVLGLFLADILYLLVVFRTIDGERVANVPHLAVSVGTGVTTLCFFVLLYYVHKLARSIIYDNVVQDVAADLRHSVDRLLPDGGGGAVPGKETLGDDFAWVGLGQDGYIQSLNLPELVSIAQKADAVIRIDVRAGHYVIGTGEHVAIHPARAASDEICRKVRSAFAIGSERTPTQDVEFGIRQMVEIATRALSPGLNDVFTAFAVIDNLSSSLAYIFNHGLESSVRHDEHGAVRVVRVVPNHAGIVSAAFDQIRQAGTGKPAVLIRLADAIARLAPCVCSDQVRRPLLRQLDLIAAAGEQSVPIEYDREVLRDRCHEARERISRGDYTKRRPTDPA